MSTHVGAYGRINMPEAVELHVRKIRWSWRRMRPSVVFDYRFGTDERGTQTLYENDKLKLTLHLDVS